MTWIFDLDGTLVDSFGHYFILLEEIFADHGVEFRDEHRRQALTQSLPDFFAETLGPAALSGAFTKLQTRSEADAASIRAFDGVPECLESLRSAGARIAVWTNRDLGSAKLILEHSGLGRYVEYCVSGTCVEKRKPDPEGLSHILARFGARAASVTVVGDHEHDVLAAKRGGVRAVRASWHAYWPIGACTQADFQFRSVPDFAAWLSTTRLKPTTAEQPVRSPFRPSSESP